MSLKEIIIGFVLAALVVVSGILVVRPTLTHPQPTGAVPGGDFYTPVTLFDGLVRSNAIATSSQGSQTVGAAEFRKWSRASTVSYSPGLLAGGTLTFPASSSIPDLVPKAGDTATFCIRNSTSTANVPVILAGGTGFNILVASSSVSALGSKTLLTGKVGCMTLTRQPSTSTTFDIDALLVTYQ